MAIKSPAAIRRVFFALAAVVLGFMLIGPNGSSRQPHAVAFEIPLEAALTTVQLEPVYETDVIDAPFTMVGFSWDGDAPERVWYRVEADGAWGDWEELLLDLDHSPDPGTAEYENQRFATEPVFTGPGDRVQFRFSGNKPRRVRAALVDTTSRTQPFLEQLLSRFTPAEADASPSQPLIRPRTDWDPSGQCPPRRQPEVIQVTMAIVHHAGSLNYAASDVPSIVLGTCLYHRNSRGWDDLAYNYMVDRYGVIWEGRAGGIDKGIRGGHTAGFSGYSTGIALMGNFTTAAPTSAQRTALEDLLTWKLALHNLDPQGTTTVVSKGSRLYGEGEVVTLNTISGHRDAQSTACPGNLCYPLLPTFRANTAARFQPLPADYYALPVSGQFTGNGAPDGAAYRRSDGTWWVTDGDTGASSAWYNGPDGGTWNDAIAADLNGNGKASIVVRSGAGVQTFTVSGSALNGSGIGSLSTSSGWHQPQLGDVTGDGDQDVIFVGSSGQVEIVTTSSVIGFGSIGSTQHVLVGDFDGDGTDDVAGFGSDGRITVARSNGGSLQAPTQWIDIAPNSDWIYALAGDFDGDGDDDVAALHGSSDTWHFLRSTGSAFTAASSITIETLDHWSEAFVFDYENDGIDEIVALDAYSGLWHMGRFDLVMPYFTKIEDSPYRTTMVHPEIAGGGSRFLTFFAQEFSWIRTDIAYDGGLDIDDIDATVRISGGSRYSTATAISQAAYPDGADTVFVATSRAFPDALAGGPAAASIDGPILLTDTTGVPAVTRTELQRLAPSRIVVLGGPGAVADSVTATLAGYASEVTRVFGADRYGTSAAISAQFFPAGANTVYIATGEDFPDALAGAAAAASNGAPILLVRPDRIPTEVAAELQRLNPDSLVLLGGTGVIASSVQSDLATLTGASTQRLAGSDRYATAAAISAAAFGSNTKVVFLTTGMNYPDAVAGAPAAHRLGAPMLLMHPDSLPLPTALELDRLRPELIVILGGEAAITEEAAEELEGYGIGSTSLPVVTLERQ